MKVKKSLSKLFFILGRNPTLSFAELLSVLRKFSLIYQVEVLAHEVAVIAFENEADSGMLMNTLGGTVKIGEIVTSIPWNQSETEFENILSAQSLTAKFFKKSSGKIRFGISVYDGGGDATYLKSLSQQLKHWHILVKENLRAQGISSGFVRVNERIIPSATVAIEQLIKKGAEIVFIVTKDALFVGYTSEVQAFEKFAARDVGRPGIDKRSGIMPPKLARMMINMGEIPMDGILLDPFCGSGTIIMESLVLGYRKIIAADSSEKAVADTQKNIRWLAASDKSISERTTNVQYIKSDVLNLSRVIDKTSIDAVVTEPFLGPPVFSQLKKTSIDRIIEELKRLYTAAFLQFYYVLKPGGKVIIIFPVYPYEGKFQFMELLDVIFRMGFALIPPLSDTYTSLPPINSTHRNTILYGGNFKFLQREILIFRKKG